MADKRCDTCKHWSGGAQPEGMCKYNAPSLVMGQVNTPQGVQTIPVGMWPITPRNGWCSRYRHGIAIAGAGEIPPQMINRGGGR